MSLLRIRWYSCLIPICFFVQLVSCATLSNNDDDMFTRYDRDAYLAARHGGKEETDSVGKEYSKEQIRELYDSRTKDQNSYDDPNQCTIYLAPSSIPNSGLGMYTTTPYQKGGLFKPEIGIMLQEMNRHYTSEKVKLLAQYPWAAQTLTFGNHEVGYGESIIPGLGMLANSHLGLVNVRHSEKWKIQPWIDGTDSYFRSDSLSMEDVGRGAHSWHGRVMFEADAPIQAGEELFVSYGDDWFTSREHLLGIVPGKAHFKEADELLHSFSLRDEEEKGESDYEQMLKDALRKDTRLRAALPNNLPDAPVALSMGTARFSAKDSIRSIEWFEENGACIDNIVSGVSTIPQAGRGAFATRSINGGERVTTTPVVTLERDQNELWENVKTTDAGEAVMELMGHQLLLNYCYGHTNSSLLFFPYAPSVNFINHGSVEESNAEIRWSTVPYHKADWLNATMDEMKEKLSTGLMFDIIATRDIQRGEEILLYYGKDWEESWNQHVKEWASMYQENVGADQPYLNLTERLGLPTSVDLNIVEQNPTVRTVGEQSENPYPPYIMTRCRFEPPEDCVSPTQSSDVHCQSRWKLSFDSLQVHPCTVLSRSTIADMDWYTAQVAVPSKETNEITLHLVEYMSRSAILFIERPYSRDQYAHGTFREVIQLPDGIIPSHWMDLNGDENKSAEEDVVQNESGGEESDQTTTGKVVLK